VKTRLGSGDVVVKNVLGLGVDVIATSNILKGDL
jgi:CxxC motif-containing protein